MEFPPYKKFDKLTPDMRVRAESFLQTLVSKGFHSIVTETWRSKERQEYLYSLGRTRPGRIVTWTLNSYHMTGEAFDIAFMIGSQLTYEGDWEAVGHIGEEHGLTWGGRWPTPDKPHFQFNSNWQISHWAAPYEEKLLKAGAITTKKNLDVPPSRGELYVIITKLHNL